MKTETNSTEHATEQWIAKHSPGCSCVVNAHRTIAWVDFWKDASMESQIPESEQQAIASLIAAAPDLLEACSKAKEAFETLKKWGEVPMHVVMLQYGIRELSEAIAKATGGKL